MTRKKKAMRKPAPFRTKTGALVAYCTEASDVASTAGTFTVDNPAGAGLKITVA